MDQNKPEVDDKYEVDDQSLDHNEYEVDDSHEREVTRCC